MRYCKKQHEDMIRADNLANSIADKEYRAFWKHVHKQESRAAARKPRDAASVFFNTKSGFKVNQSHVFGVSGITVRQ